MEPLEFRGIDQIRQEIMLRTDVDQPMHGIPEDAVFFKHGYWAALAFRF